MPEHTRTTTPFDAASTANRVLEGVDLTGRRAVVTGASSGIGVETARALAGAGAEVTLAVRNPAAGKSTAADITATTGNARLRVAALDLTDQSSVAEFTSAWQGPLHILVNNAGVMAAPETRTSEGWELQFATNHYGHFKLTTELHGALASEGARVVAVSSSAHLLSGVVFDDIHFRQREYTPWSAYGQSKSANVLFAVAASKRWAPEGITANALMPGAIHTNLQRHIDDEEVERLRRETPGAHELTWKTPEQGAATSALLAASPLVDGVTGRYFEDCNEAERHQEGALHGVADHALDPDAAERLWKLSTDVTR